MPTTSNLAAVPGIKGEIRDCRRVGGAGGSDGLFFRVLGPLEVEVAGTAVNVGGPISRRVLAALLNANGSAVSDAALVKLAWSERPLSEAITALRVAISRLRSLLGDEGRGMLRRVGSGYRLAVPPASTDYGRFTASVRGGLESLSAGEADRAATAFRSALGCWRGEPWPELGDALATSGARARLAELREVAIEELQAALLELGEVAPAVAALSEAVIAAPYRERRWELLVLGLYRGGRQADALAELRRARQLLANDLGAEPGPALRELEQRVLAHDPTLLGPNTAPTPTPTPAPLPPATGISKPWTSLVGRAELLRLLGELLRNHRLVTLLGPAGVGKTRTALEHAAAHQPSQGEVWLARLADIHSAQDVVASIAAAVGVIHLSIDPLGLVAYALVDRPGLLVLDNCEHLLEPVADLSQRLLAACPELRILITSRTPVNVDDEHILPVEPLPVLDDHGRDTHAVDLLFDRVRQHRTEWIPTVIEHHAARKICTLLDGLPLAIELAAAGERAHGLPAIAAHLTGHLDPLPATPKGSINPHASLEAAIAWSVDQLTATDQAMLLRLWPFEGGFTWHAARAVKPQRVDAVLATLASLKDHSVITADTSTQPTRYRMLDTIRRYCHDHDPNSTETQEAHAAWIRRLAAEQAKLIAGPRAGQDLRVLIAELANIRAGIVHDLEHNPSAALRTTGTLAFLWPKLGALPEWMRLTQAALDASQDPAVEDRVDGLLALSIASFHADDSVEAVRLADAAIRTFGEPTGEQGRLLLKALVYRAAAAGDLGDVDLVRATLDRFALEARRWPAPDWVRANALLCEGELQLNLGNESLGETTLGAARALARQCGYFFVEGIADLVLARGLLRGTTPDPARAHRAGIILSRALTVFQDQGNAMDQLAVLYSGAHALATLGAEAAAVTLRASVIEHAGRIGITLTRYARLSGFEAEHRMSALLDKPERTAAQNTGKALAWPDMIILFTDTISQTIEDNHLSRSPQCYEARAGAPANEPPSENAAWVRNSPAAACPRSCMSQKLPDTTAPRTQLSTAPTIGSMYPARQISRRPPIARLVAAFVPQIWNITGIAAVATHDATNGAPCIKQLW